MYKKIYKIGWYFNDNDLSSLIFKENIRLDKIFDVEGQVHSMQVYHAYYDPRVDFLNDDYYRKQVYDNDCVIFDAMVAEKVHYCRGKISNLFWSIFV